MEMSATDVMNRGMQCLVESMGIIEAEQFISIVMQEKFDYTKWQKEHFDTMSKEELHQNTVQYATDHPYRGKAQMLVK